MTVIKLRARATAITIPTILTDLEAILYLGFQNDETYRLPIDAVVSSGKYTTESMDF